MNTFKKIHAAILAADEKTHLKWLYIIAAICMVLNFMLFKISFDFDTTSYISAGEVLMSGHLDSFRTPFYPLLIAVAQRISEIHYARVVVAVQLVFYFVSIPYLYRLNAFYIKNKALLFAASAIYVALPQFSAWALCLMTECIALSLTIIFSYYLLRFIKTGSAKASVLCNLILVFMLLLRPSFLYLFVVLAIVHIYLFVKRRNNILNVAAFLVVIATHLLYCYAYKQEYGVFTTGDVQYNNQRSILNLIHLVDYSNLDKDYVEKFVVEKEGKTVLDEESLWWSLSPKEKSEVISNSLRKNWFAYTGYNLRKFFFVSGEPCCIVYPRPRNELYGRLINNVAQATCTLLMVYVLFFAYFCVLARQLWRRRFPILNIYMWLIVVGMFVTSIFGAGDDWERLVLPCTPFITIGEFQLVDKLQIRVKDWELG
ncbi:MAG: glycosyltransferase family 39 protein [Muribaculaceae bacterium]|nr:glycosyltransferase family 39 protein [Muribaculaceae bacterium]